MYGGSGTCPALDLASSIDDPSRVERRTSNRPSSPFPSNSTTSASFTMRVPGRRAFDARASARQRWLVSPVLLSTSPSFRTRKTSLLPPVPSFEPRIRAGSTFVSFTTTSVPGAMWSASSAMDSMLAERHSAARPGAAPARVRARVPARSARSATRNRTARRASPCHSTVTVSVGCARRAAGRELLGSSTLRPRAVSACQRRRELGGPETLARMKATTSPTS